MDQEITKEDIVKQGYEVIDSVWINDKHVEVWSKTDEDMMGWNYVLTHLSWEQGLTVLNEKPLLLAPCQSTIESLVRESGLIDEIGYLERNLEIKIDGDIYYEGILEIGNLRCNVISEMLMDKYVTEESSIEIITPSVQVASISYPFLGYVSPNKTHIDQKDEFRLLATAERLILAGSAKEFEIYIKTQSHLINEPWSNGRTLMHAAAWSGDVSKINTLIRAGAGIDVKDQWGNTPLMFAAIQGHDAAMMALVQSGAETHATNAKGHDIKSLAKIHMTEEDLPVLKTIQAKDMAMDIIAEMGLLFTTKVKPN